MHGPWPWTRRAVPGKHDDAPPLPRSRHLLQLIQIVGALAILAAFAFAQFGLLAQSWSYLGLNLVGATVLAILAYIERQWSFLLLEGVWALVSAWGLGVRVQRPLPGGAESR